MKVLYLTPWYPSKKDEMSGLFVRKHVEAVRAQGVEVRVIFAESWRETVRQWKALRREGWIPDVVQLNVIQKQGLLALWLKKRYGIPYVIVEHWSGYLPENGMFKRLSAIKKRIYRRIAAQAEQVLCVSQRLQQAMQDCGIRAQQWGLIDNVVDGFFFEKVESKKTEVESRKTKVESKKTKVESKKTLLHVSCFDERAKNVKGLLRAAKMLSEKRQDWKLVLVGTGADYEDVRAFADTLDIPEGLLEWTGELTPSEVAERMHEADALVLSSRYETYGVVLAEAAAAGLPILSTPVGIAENVANLIVPQEIAQNKPGRMAEFMETILWGQEVRVKSQEVRERFSADFIGKKLKKSYDSCLHRDI